MGALALVHQTTVGKPVLEIPEDADDEPSRSTARTAGRARQATIGFFQIGGGIAGDFPICVVPMMHQDLRSSTCPLWGYFCQISDSTTSYGSYSGAVPNEKITWGKLGMDTPQVHHRVRRDDRRAADFRLRARLVIR